MDASKLTHASEVSQFVIEPNRIFVIGITLLSGAVDLNQIHLQAALSDIIGLGRARRRPIPRTPCRLAISLRLR
jgi:hypothetical protein